MLVLGFLLLCVSAYGSNSRYCISGATNSLDTNLGPVQLVGNTQSIKDDTGCPGLTGPVDLTNLVADVTPGQRYSLDYSVITCGTRFAATSAAWVDWNQDGKFENTEILFPYSTQFGDLSYSFVVPSDALLGATVMRVQVQETSSPTIDPCASFPWGETKDYSIVVGQTNAYCISGATNTMDTNLGPVALLGDTQTILENSTCPGQIGPIDFTSMIADVTPGKQYTISYSVITCLNQFPTTSVVWVDWNHNKLFESSEILFPYSHVFGPQSYTFTVPLTASLGVTRMRVQVQETSSASIDPCASFPWGETKDFSISVGSYCDSGATNALDTNLGPVELIGNTKNILENSTCPGQLGPIDYTSMVADLTLGKKYEITYSVITCSAIQFPTTSVVWIDWNQNRNFEATEILFPYSHVFGSQTYTFVVPETALLGVTRMRVQVQETSSASIDPCAPFPWGETKDFSISVGSP